MTNYLTDEKIDRYNSEGFLSPLNIISEQEATEHRKELEKAEVVHFPMHFKTKPYLFFLPAYRLATNPILLDKIESILGPNILLWDSAYVIKEPNDTNFLWHQDLIYWGLSDDKLVSAWVAISDSSINNGCMRFIPKTHLHGELQHRDQKTKNTILYRGQSVKYDIKEEDVVDITLNPGQASLHHGHVIHSSNPNISKRRRIGLTIQYIAPEVKQLNVKGETATLVRGEDRYDYYNKEPLPKANFEESAIAFYYKMQKLKHQIYDK